MTLCPCCGQPIHAPRVPIEALEAAPLQPQQRIILRRLVRVYPRWATRDQLFDELYGLDPNGGPEQVTNAISVRIHGIRKVIERYGWTIPPQKGGMGVQGHYKLEPLP
jgi:hypothetical protein